MEIINHVFFFFFFAAIRELFHRIQEIHKQVIIIPLAKQLTNIHRLFTEETPLFASEIFVIESLNAVNPSIRIYSLLFRLILVSTNIYSSTIDRSETTDYSREFSSDISQSNRFISNQRFAYID